LEDVVSSNTRVIQLNVEKIVDTRRRAEAAVADMPDGPLKVAAFQTILDRLLSGLQSAADQSVRTPPPSRKVAPHGHPNPSTSNARILSLREAAFFDQERSLREIRDRLRLQGWVYPLSSLSGTVQTLVQRRELRRTVKSNGARKVYAYVKP
jgi:hypothetical protein